MFTIEDAKQAQRDLGLGEFHVVYLDRAEGWVMAHTDAERATGMDLTTCDVHEWLVTDTDGSYLGLYLPLRARSGWLAIARQPGKKELLVTGLALLLDERSSPVPSKNWVRK